MIILDVKIDKYTKSQFGALLRGYLDSKKVIKISKINTEFLHRALGDGKFFKILNSSDVNIVDGRGVLWAARYLTLPISDSKFIRPIQAIWQMIYSCVFIVFHPKFITDPIIEPIPGIIAFKVMMRAASDKKVGVFLFGSSVDTIKTATKKIKLEFPDLKISGTMNGYDFQKNNSIDPVAEINKTDAKILIVALGSPKQEYWINDNIDKLKNIQIAVGEGGTLDRIANPSQKSPDFINNIGLEWFWRMIFNESKTSTRNRFQRFWNSVPSFIGEVVRWKIKNGQTKI